jgi:hypothetical protein
MKTILDYCLHNFDTLLQYRQPSFKWKQNYDLSKLCKIPNFEKLRDMLINAKIPRHAESPFYDILEEKIRKTQGTGSGYEVIFETIDL